MKILNDDPAWFACGLAATSESVVQAANHCPPCSDQWFTQWMWIAFSATVLHGAAKSAGAENTVLALEAIAAFSTILVTVKTYFFGQKTMAAFWRSRDRKA